MKSFYMTAVISLLFITCFLTFSVAEEPLVWESTYTDVTPKIDGMVDGVWAKAKPLTVTVREAIGGTEPTKVELRALHTKDTFYVLAQWPDATRSDMRDPYVWNNKKKTYERPTKPDDQFALEFPISGDFDSNMLSLTKSFTADVWHWKAGRGNPIGWVDDKRHIISQDPDSGGTMYSMGGHGTVYIARLSDEGDSSYANIPEPTSYVGDIVDSYKPQEPTGSRTDVQGKGVHDGNGWTLEMSRKFNTGHEDDAVINPSKDNLCAIAVLNDELYFNHSVSTVIILRFSGQ